jgi:hypothetical protein
VKDSQQPSTTSPVSSKLGLARLLGGNQSFVGGDREVLEGVTGDAALDDLVADEQA